MNIRIHYSFVIYIFILFFLGLLKFFSIFLLSVLIHEFTHAIIGYLFGLKIKCLNIDMCGISVKFNNMDVDYIKRILIYISGPTINLIIAIIIHFLMSENFSFFELTNFVLFIFNIIPIYPLDGGKIAYEIVDHFLYKKIVIFKKIYVYLQVMLLLVLSYICINYSNLPLFFMGVYFLRFTIESNNQNMTLF